MKILRNVIKNETNIRTFKDFPKEGIEFIDITPLFIEKDVFKEICDLFYDELKDKDIDYIVGPEARGFLLASVLADRLGVGFVPIRKRGKLPLNAIEKSVMYEKEYGKDSLELPKLITGNYKNKKFYILDDIYATGNTMKAIEEGITDLGGSITGLGAILNIKELNNRKDIFSLIDVNEE